MGSRASVASQQLRRWSAKAATKISNMAKHARTPITVPADLKARMDAIEDSVNWSAVACQAFEQKLAEFIKRKGGGNMKDVVNRLRASKQAFENEEYQAGHEAGQTWAKDDAEAGELILLSGWRDRSGREWNHCFRTGDNDAYGCSEHFAFTVWPEHDGDRQMAGEFWESNAGAEYPTDDFIRGFADGALSVWDEVKDEL